MNWWNSVSRKADMSEASDEEKWKSEGGVHKDTLSFFARFRTLRVNFRLPIKHYFCRRIRIRVSKPKKICLAMKAFLKCAAIALALFGCSQFGHHLNSDDELEGLIAAEVHAAVSGNIGLVTLSEVGDFPWDHLLILAPYTALSTVEDSLGVKLSSLGHFGINERDDVTLMVFVEGDTPVRAVAYPRSAGDFAEVEPVLIPREKAIFPIEPMPNGRVKMRLAGQ